MLLYPRLSPQQGKRLAEERAAMPLLELERLADITYPNVTFAPTGGVRVTPAQLQSLRNSIRETTRKHGYKYGVAGGEPLPLAAERKAEFDAALAMTIHQQMDVTPSEACRPGVWRFLGTVLAPESIRWRFPGEKTTHERFLGNRLRNMYGRVWWRAHLLEDSAHDDPYWLLKELGEDELVQITERPNAAGYKPLAMGIARGLVTQWDPEVGVSRSGLLREVMKRVLRLLPLLRFESLTHEEVAAEVDALYVETLRGLGIEVTVQVQAPDVLWDADAQWQDLALHRRAEFLKAVTDEDITRLTSLKDATFPDWGEYKARWKALFRIRATAGQVLELAPEPEGLPRGDELGAWLTAEPAGSWQRDVDPARARRFLGALRRPDVQALFTNIGWEWSDLMTHSGSQRYLRRRYSGSWETLIEALPEDTLAHVGRFLRLSTEEQPRDALRLTLARWLLVKPDLEWHAAYASYEVGSAADTPEATPETVSPVDLDASIPRPELRLDNVLRRAEVKTLRDLVALDLFELSRMRGVGQTIIDGIRAFRDGLLSGVRVPDPLQAVEVDLDDRHRDLPEPPSLIANLLRKLEVRTFGELFALDLQEVGEIRGVGAKKVDAIHAFRQELLARPSPGDTSPHEPPQPVTLDDLVLRMLDELQEREATAISMRFEKGATLAELGDALGLSRERARQIAREALRKLHVSFGRDAAALLENACPEFGGVAYDVQALGIEPWRALLVATVAHTTSWIYAEPILWPETASSLKALESAVSGSIEVRRVEADRIAELAVELEVPEAVLRLVMTRRMTWLERNGALVLPEAEMEHDDWILSRLKEAGPTHQNVVGQWLMERDGLSAEEQTEKSRSYIRKAEQLLSRLEDAWRWDRGTFIHTAGIPVSQAELRAMVAWCVERIEGRTGPYGVKKLLGELDEAGFDVSALNWYLMKDALVRDEGAIALRKGNVACANSYDEVGIDLEERILEVLRRAEGPLDVSTVLRRLPPNYDVSEVAVRHRLSTSESVVSPKRGIYQAKQMDSA